MYVREVPGSRTLWPITESQLKEYVGLPEAYSSALLPLYIQEATAKVEQAGWATTAHTIDVYATPLSGGRLAIPRVPLAEIAEVAAIALDGSESLLPSDQWRLDESRLVPVLWCSSLLAERLRVRCTVGYSTVESIPAAIRLAVLRTAGRMWEEKTVDVPPVVQPIEDDELCLSWRYA